MFKFRATFLGLLIVVQLIDCYLSGSGAQFFTKSSKSIPRMGRRSVGTGNEIAMRSYRRLLIDNLVDEHRPNLLTALEMARANEERQLQSNNLMGSSSELVVRDDQPFDFVEMTANERQPDPRSGPNSAKLTGLAMRALNANRYQQHLAYDQPLGAYAKQVQQQQPQHSSTMSGK